MSRRADARGWLVDLVFGGLVGLIVGIVAAVNLVIFTGVEGGYEAGIGDVFEHSVVLGTIVLMFLAAGPIGGVVVARRQRATRRRAVRAPEPDASIDLRRKT